MTTTEPEASDGVVQPPKPSRIVPALVALAACLALSTVAFAGLWISERSDGGLGGTDAPHLFDAAEVVVADKDGITWRGNGDTLTVEVGPYSDSAWMEEYLDAIGFPLSVYRRMGQTRALDGTQEAESNGVRVTWTYHPDDGLSAVFSAEGD
jgi:hypothetical protein